MRFMHLNRWSFWRERRRERETQRKRRTFIQMIPGQVLWIANKIQLLITSDKKKKKTPIIYLSWDAVCTSWDFLFFFFLFLSMDYLSFILNSWAHITDFISSQFQKKFLSLFQWTRNGVAFTCAWIILYRK